jgi:hypothetical protein
MDRKHLQILFYTKLAAMVATFQLLVCGFTIVGHYNSSTVDYSLSSSSLQNFVRITLAFAMNLSVLTLHSYALVICSRLTKSYSRSVTAITINGKGLVNVNAY